MACTFVCCSKKNKNQSFHLDNNAENKIEMKEI